MQTSVLGGFGSELASHLPICRLTNAKVTPPSDLESFLISREALDDERAALPDRRTDVRTSAPFGIHAASGLMHPMTPSELHKLLIEAIAAAHQELAGADAHEDPAVRRAHEILTSAIDRVIHAAHEAHSAQANLGAVVADIHRQRRVEACPCTCHSDGNGNREWPLLADSVGSITACSRCREDHERAAPRRDSAA